MNPNPWLVAAALLDGGAALLHLGCIAGGARWYRFFGAGERFARLAEAGSSKPALVTAGIAAVLGVWCCYALSAAGLLPRLPFLRVGLVAICAIYFLRAAALPVMLATMPGRSRSFLIVSSVIVLAFAIVHALGIRSARWD